MALILFTLALGFLCQAYLFFRVCARLDKLEQDLRVFHALEERERENIKNLTKSSFEGLQESIHRAIFEFTSASRQLDAALDVLSEVKERSSNDGSLEDGIHQPDC